MEELMVKLMRIEGETPPCVTETEESSRLAFFSVPIFQFLFFSLDRVMPARSDPIE
jgi:hypothetical protein